MLPKTTVLVLTTMLFSQVLLGQSISGDMVMKDANEASITMKDYNSYGAVVMIFYCNTCPFSNYYDERIMSLKDSYENIKFLLVNSSPEKYDPGESLDEMKSISLRLGLTFINDKSQNLKGILNASKCPEAYLLKKKGSSWEVSYHGAIDDNPKDGGSAKTKYLEKAISEVQNNQGPKEKTVRPVGCIIKTG